MKKCIINISPAKTETSFYFGGCTIKAFTQAFDIPEKTLVLIGSLMKMDIKNGLTFWECCKILNKIAEFHHLNITYITNSSRVEYGQMLSLLNKGKYIALFDIHVSYCYNGEVFDDYFFDEDEEIRLANLQKVPTGWWEIK